MESFSLVWTFWGRVWLLLVFDGTERPRETRFFWPMALVGPGGPHLSDMQNLRTSPTFRPLLSCCPEDHLKEQERRNVLPEIYLWLGSWVCEGKKYEGEAHPRFGTESRGRKASCLSAASTRGRPSDEQSNRWSVPSGTPRTVEARCMCCRLKQMQLSRTNGSGPGLPLGAGDAELNQTRCLPQGAQCSRGGRQQPHMYIVFPTLKDLSLEEVSG